MINQPEPIEVEMVLRGKSVMYSMLDEFTLRRLHKFIGELIEWKAAGNTTHIETKLFAIIEECNNDNR